MNATIRPLTVFEKAARLQAENPTMSYSQIMSELSRRRRQRKPLGISHAVRTEPPRYAWQERKDLA